ncbi:MAG TPA: hypothetical protein VGC41_03465, partial [Kofleriaceae bacterium]
MNLRLNGAASGRLLESSALDHGDVRNYVNQRRQRASANTEAGPSRTERIAIEKAPSNCRLRSTWALRPFTALQCDVEGAGRSQSAGSLTAAETFLGRDQVPAIGFSHHAPR